ncbi:MAG: hypothetical protein WA510_19820 [Acidobacteriaceae bacterium]
MKSDIRTFVLPAGAAASKRPITSEPNRIQRRFGFKTPHLFLLLGLLAPVHGFAAEAPYCIAVNGGFGSGGTTFVARNFTLPTEGKCNPWSGYTKTADTVVVTTSGTSCLSSDSVALTVSVTSQSPDWFGPKELGIDYIQLTRANSTEPFTGWDTGYFAGTAAPVTCTSSLLTLPSTP